MDLFETSPPLAWLLFSFLSPLEQRRCAATQRLLELSRARQTPTLWILGGTGPPSLESVEAFDPSKRRWEFLPPLPVRRCGHCACILGHHLYVLGGVSAPREAVRWSRASEWQALPTMPIPRVDAAAVVLESYLYVLGGSGNANASNKPLTLCSRWVPGIDEAIDSGVWESVPSMSTGRSSLAAVAINMATGAGPSLLATGGRGLNSCESFELTRWRWRQGPSMALGRESHAAVATEGRVLVMGGLCHGRPSASVECWFPMGSKRWTTLPSLRLRRSAPCAAVLAGKVYVCGGSDGAQSLSTVESYDLRELRATWQLEPSLRVARSRACAVVWPAGSAENQSDKKEGLPQTLRDAT
eukprot:symbB.v1.2.033258.t1/scaffold4106.1/size44601/2